MPCLRALFFCLAASFGCNSIALPPGDSSDMQEVSKTQASSDMQASSDTQARDMAGCGASTCGGCPMGCTARDTCDPVSRMWKCDCDCPAVPCGPSLMCKNGEVCVRCFPGPGGADPKFACAANPVCNAASCNQACGFGGICGPGQAGAYSYSCGGR
jgi:hypothetical protein